MEPFDYAQDKLATKVKCIFPCWVKKYNHKKGWLHLSELLFLLYCLIQHPHFNGFFYFPQ